MTYLETHIGQEIPDRLCRAASVQDNFVDVKGAVSINSSCHVRQIILLHSFTTEMKWDIETLGISRRCWKS